MENLPPRDSFASKWIDLNSSKFSKLESEAFEAYKKFIISTIKEGDRANGDRDRQVQNLDASPRQLINGVVNTVKSLSSNSQESYENYVKKIGNLQKKVYELVIDLNILPGSSIFSEEETKNYTLSNSEKKKIPKLITEKEMTEIAKERLEIATHIINTLKDDPNLGRTKLAKIFYVSDALIDT